MKPLVEGFETITDSTTAAYFQAARSRISFDNGVLQCLCDVLGKNYPRVAHK
jgi:hypothetical protein